MAAGLSLWGCASGTQGKASVPVVRTLSLASGQTDTLEARYLKLGFNIGYLTQVGVVEPALRQIKDDGFNYVRVYEPFTRGDDAHFTRAVRGLRRLAAQDLRPVLCLSNFPPDLAAADSNRTLPSSPFPASKRQEILSYSNRYAPADLVTYRAALGQMFEALRDTVGTDVLKEWYFEIGNEPDAPRFFWGSPDDFRRVLSAAIDTLKALDPHITVGAAAFTSRLVSEPGLRPAFTRLAREIAGDPRIDFFSIHLYDNSNPKGQSASDLIASFAQTSKPRVISEWNVSSVGNRRTEQLIRSPKFMRHLIDAVAASYANKVELLVIFKLMDYPDRGNYQLGLFDSEGAPKRAYRYVQLIGQLVRDGYTAEDLPELTILRGKNLIAVASKARGSSVDFSGYHVIESSVAIDTAEGILPPNEWIVLRRSE